MSLINCEPLTILPSVSLKPLMRDILQKPLEKWWGPGLQGFSQPLVWKAQPPALLWEDDPGLQAFGARRNMRVFSSCSS